MDEVERKMHVSIHNDFHVYDVESNKVYVKKLGGNSNVFTVDLADNITVFFQSLDELGKFVSALWVQTRAMIRDKELESK